MAATVVIVTMLVFYAAVAVSAVVYLRHRGEKNHSPVTGVRRLR